MTQGQTNQSPVNNSLDPRLKDKFWRLNNLYKIIDKKGNLSTFTLNPHQKTLYDALQNHPRQVIPKARQLGVTTFFTLYMFDDVLFKPNYKAVLISHELKSMTTIFEKVQVAWQEFPAPIKQVVGWEERTDNKNEIKFNNYSSFQVTLSSRGGTVNHLHISEASKIQKEYPEKWKEIRTGSFPSVTPNGKITLESTVEQPEGDFTITYNEGFDVKEPQHTEKDFQRFFFSWAKEPQYSLHNPHLYKELPSKFLQYQKEHNLTDDQITWYYSTQKSEKLTDQELKQQYPTTVEEAFSASIDAFFDTENINSRLKNDTHSPIEVINGWHIFEKYNPKHLYAMGCDVGEGIKRDSSTAIIVDFSHRLENYQIVPKVVARYKINSKDTSEFAEIIADGGRLFGTCIIGVERNNPGLAVLMKLKEIYPNIYKQIVKDYIEDREVERYGFLTTGSSKPLIFSELKNAVNERGVIIPDTDLLKELKVYGVEDFKRIKDDTTITHHLDLVPALAIAWELRNSATGSYSSEPEYVTAEMDHSARMLQI